MKKFGVTIIGLLALSAMSAFGTTISACTTAGDSLTFALSSTSGNTYTCGDKVFSNISGTAGIAGNVTITELNTDQYKFSFLAGGGGFTSAFVLTFDVAVAAGFPTWNISQIQESMQTGVAAGGGQSIPNGSTAALTLSSGSFTPATVNGLTSPGQNSIANVFSKTETVGFSYNPTGTASDAACGGPCAAGKFTSIDYIINQTSVPEPMTLSLMGLGLLGFGVFGRKRMVKR